MFTFTKCDDGLHAENQDGRTVAHVETKILSETADPNLRVQKKVETPLAKEDWRIHFTGTKLTAAEAEAFLQELSAQTDKK